MNKVECDHCGKQATTGGSGLATPWFQVTRLPIASYELVSREENRERQFCSWQCVSEFSALRVGQQ